MSETTKSGRLERVAGFRGVNYWPTYARSPVDNWNDSCDREVVRRELGFARDMGFNSVRLWNSVWGYYSDPDLYIDNLTFVLDQCSALGLDVDLVLFDSCGIDPEIGGGFDGSSETTLEERVAKLGPNDPGTKLISGWATDSRMDIYEAGAMVPVPDRADGTVAIWEGFVPSPGYYHLNRQEWPKWEAFARRLAILARDHPSVALIELMNEPFVTHLGGDIDKSPIRRFYKQVHSLFLQVAPEMPLTIGADGRNFTSYEADLEVPLDVISLHPLTFSKEQFTADLRWAAGIARESGRVALASEWGSFPGPHDADQLGVYRDELPVAIESGVAWMISHLIAGYGPFALTALLYPNGTMRPAAKYVRETLLESSAVVP